MERILEGTVDDIRKAVKDITDVEELAALVEAEEGADKPRSTVLAAIDARLDELNDTVAPPPVEKPAAVAAPGSLAAILTGDIDVIRRAVMTQLDTERQLDALADLETAGKKRAGVYIAIEARRLTLRPRRDSKGVEKLPMPVVLDLKTGEPVAHADVEILGHKMKPEYQAVAVLYASEMAQHRGTFKVYLSVKNGQPIYDLGILGDYGKLLCKQAIAELEAGAA